MTEEKLSKRAAKLLERVRSGRWYPWSGPRSGPKAMQELIDAGLVTVSGRNQTIAACYVPTGFIHRDDMMPPDDGGQPFASRLYRTPYLVIPRLALEAMPLDWQRQFEALLLEADAAGLATPEYHVFRKDGGHTVVDLEDGDDENSAITALSVVRSDPWSNYRRGDIADVCPTFKKEAGA